jgi:hypothetical protein
MAGTVVPDAEAMMIRARRTRIDSWLPRRTRRNRYRPLVWMQAAGPDGFGHDTPRFPTSARSRMRRSAVRVTHLGRRVACQPGDRLWSPH